MNTATIARALGLTLLLAGASPLALAQSSSARAGHWDASLHVLYEDSKSLGSDNGSSAEVDSSAGWGFGVGYNFDNHWYVDMNFSARNADYTATTTPQPGNPNRPQNFSGTLSTDSFAVNGTYHFFDGALTPFVTAGLGATYVNTDIPSGLPVNVCWYDPWWGYYCGPVVPTKSDTYFSYNAGVGVRWDAPQSLFVRGLVSQQWIDVGGGVGQPSFTQFRIDIGARF
ncbi:MAG TPA: outer membrane beta-barrel protein [Burkholderiales bacterium]|nr:outer membrane beta-barrel protein [Burkholderiales bacterium]